MTYSQKLRDPRWQKKRLYILERDKWSCHACQATDRNLQVHHLYYAKLDPWEYPDEAYQTLCEPCHELRQQIIDSRIEELRLALGDVATNELEELLKSMVNSARYPDISGGFWKCKDRNDTEYHCRAPIGEESHFYGYIVGLRIEESDNSDERKKYYAIFSLGGSPKEWIVPDADLFEILSGHLTQMAKVREVSGGDDYGYNKLYIEKTDGKWKVELP